MRLIDADDLIEVFIAFALMRSGQYRESFTNADGVRSIEIDCAEDIINRQKTIDAEPVKHARWIDQQHLIFKHEIFKCSNCGHFLDFGGVNAGRGDANYCPNCGARMDGKVEGMMK